MLHQILRAAPSWSMGAICSLPFNEDVMDFTLSPEHEQLRTEIKAFVDTHLIPLEKDPSAYDEHENINTDALQRMREKAKSQGLWCLQMPVERGGRGLSMVGMAAC